MSSELINQVIEVLKSIYDPEIPINVYDLGLIYNISIDDEGVVRIDMTLTTPGCPIAFYVVQQIINSVKNIKGVNDVKVNVTFSPPWNPLRMTKDGRERFKQLFGYDIVEEFLKTHGGIKENASK